MTDKCKTCGHASHAHTAAQCTVKRVSGPPSTKGRKIGDGYEHVGRVETPCTCTAFVTSRNGVAVH